MSFLKREKEQLKLRETGQTVQLFIVEQFGFSHYLDGEILKYIETLAANGANGFRTFGFFPFGLGREEEPFPRSGSNFNLDRFNAKFYNYQQQWIEHAQKHGIVVLYELFDSVGVKYPQLETHHPFGRFFKREGNNHTRRLNAFTTLGGQLEKYQKAYIKHTVNLFKQYPNVIFGIMNEFKGNARWHHEMSKYVRKFAPNHLISGSDDSSPGLDDPHVDIWTIHTGSYSFTHSKSNIRRDLAGFVPKIGKKIPAYSTDGFGSRGKPCENPTAMKALALDIKKNKVQIFRFLDQKAFISRDDAGNELPGGSWGTNSEAFETAQVKLANTETYRAIAEVLQPTKFQEPEPVELPPGFICAFQAIRLPSEHPDAFDAQGGKAIKATRTQGFLAKTPQIDNYKGKPLPEKALDAYVSVFIDNNTFDDAIILIIDIYDTNAQRVLGNWAVTRKQFAKAGDFNLLKLSFTPSSTSALEFRVYYFGSAYVIVDKIALVQPEDLQQAITSPSDIPDEHSLGSTTEETPAEDEEDETGENEEPDPEDDNDDSPPPEETQGGIIGLFPVAKLPSAHPEIFATPNNGKAVKATTREGFLAYGPYVEGFPNKPLEVYFSLLVDNNTADNRQLFVIDVHDAMQQRLLAKKYISRRDFPSAKTFTLFKLSFTPSSTSRLEFRIFYKGYSYAEANKIVVVDPEKIQFTNASEIPDSLETPMPETPVNPEDPPIITPPPSDFCSGNEILCIPQFNKDVIQSLGGKNYGGDFRGDTYTPANRGGILFEKSLDTTRKIKIRIELKGNIANVHKTGENDGGKVTLFAIKEKNGSYYMSLQRMHKDYRGGGLFRFILTDNSGSTEGAGYVITANNLSGLYQTQKWGNEPHTIQVLIERNQCRLYIDDNYKSRTSRCSGNISGVKPCEIMVGNRLVRYSNQQAITQFARFKIEYI